MSSSTVGGGGGLYRYKHKPGLSHTTMFYKALVSQILILIFLVISTVSNIDIFAASKTFNNKVELLFKLHRILKRNMSASLKL